MRRIEAGLRGVVLALLVLLVARAFEAAWANMVFPYDLAQAVEISLALQGRLLFEGAPVYVDPRTHLPFYTQIYYPGYAALIGALLAVFPDLILVPRAVGAFAYLLLCAAVYLAARLAGASRGGAIAGAALAVVAQAAGMSFANRVARGPYLLLVVAALLAAQRALATRRDRWIVCAAILAVGTTWFHQTGLLLAGVLAAALWPLGPRRSLAAAAAVVAATGVLVLLMNVGTDGWFQVHTASSMRRQDLRLGNWIETAQYLGKRWWPILLLLGWGIWKTLARRDLPLLPWTAFTCVFLPWEVFTSGMVGAGPSHVHTLAPAAGVFAARAWTDSTADRPLARLFLPLLLAAGAYTTHGPIPRPSPADLEAGARIAAHMAARPGPVLAERHLGLPAAVGRETDADVARLWELWRYAEMEPEALTRAVRARRYALILTSRVYEPPSFREAVDEAYLEVDRIRSTGDFWYDIHVLVPRPTPEREPPR